MALAIFDLDNTLIDGDSDHAWGEFLVEIGAVDPQLYKKMNDKFYQDYKDGCLNIYEYLDFSLEPLTRFEEAQLLEWRAQFVETKIKPIIPNAAKAKVQEHKNKGDQLLIITATNRFVTEPIAELFGIEELLAIELERKESRYTGKPTGTLSFQEGKITRLKAWLEEKNIDMSGAWFYSDSHNDLPLLDLVDFPVAVSPDPTLEEQAKLKGWQTITLRD